MQILISYVYLVMDIFDKVKTYTNIKYQYQGGGILLSYIPPVPQFHSHTDDQVNHCEKKDVEMETDENEPLGEEKCLGSPSISGSVSSYSFLDN